MKKENEVNEINKILKIQNKNIRSRIVTKKTTFKL